MKDTELWEYLIYPLIFLHTSGDMLPTLF